MEYGAAPLGSMEVEMRRFALLGCLVGLACGPTVSDPGANADGGGTQLPDAYTGPVATVTGTVWAPGNAPGMVPAGHEIPIHNALVYVSLQKPPPIPQAVHCDQCVDPPGTHTLTDHQGRFTLPNVQPGSYWLTIQKGQFRLEQQVTLAENQVLELTTPQSTLPSAHDPDNGKWIPKIAIASGFWDHIEDILGKMGLGSVDGSGQFQGASAAGVFDIYSNGGRVDNVALEGFDTFLADYNKMSQYHIIFVPCSTSTFGSNGLQSAPMQMLLNLRQFVSDGGKLYVTDWSGEYADNIFPEQMRFASDHDTPAEAWNGSTWNTALFNDGDGFSANEAEHAYALDQDLYSWLDGQAGPTVLGFGSYGQGTYDAGDFVLEGKYDYIEELVDVQVGVDDEGFPVFDRPKAWVIGDEAGTPDNCAGPNPQCSAFTVTFEPVGCGRVLYSTYHTADSNHVGLVPQERVLLYLIMEIGVCKSGPIIE